jgi:hypothetical protein
LLTYSSARVLDPHFAIGKNIDLLADKIKALQSFGFDEFCDASSGIISVMIPELPAYIAMVNATTNSFCFWIILKEPKNMKTWQRRALMIQ